MNKIQNTSQNLKFRFIIKDNRNRQFKPRLKSCTRSSSNQHNQRSHSALRPKKINFAALGIQDRCIKCGQDNHRVRDYRVKHDSLHCTECDKKGHVAKVCISTLIKKSRSNNGR